MIRASILHFIIMLKARVSLIGLTEFLSQSIKGSIALEPLIEANHTKLEEIVMNIVGLCCTL